MRGVRIEVMLARVTDGMPRPQQTEVTSERTTIRNLGINSEAGETQLHTVEKLLLKQPILPRGFLNV